jgi:hypothetical protein
MKNIKDLTWKEKKKLFLQEYTELCKKYDLMFDALSQDCKSFGQLCLGSEISSYVDTDKPFKFVEIILGNGEAVIDLDGDYHSIVIKKK